MAGKPTGSLNFVCEIPKWTRKKFELATKEALNPIKQVYTHTHTRTHARTHARARARAQARTCTILVNIIQCIIMKIIMTIIILLIILKLIIIINFSCTYTGRKEGAAAVV